MLFKAVAIISMIHPLTTETYCNRSRYVKWVHMRATELLTSAFSYSNHFQSPGDGLGIDLCLKIHA